MNAQEIRKVTQDLGLRLEKALACHDADTGTAMVAAVGSISALAIFAGEIAAQLAERNERLSEIQANNEQRLVLRLARVLSILYAEVSLGFSSHGSTPMARAMREAAALVRELREAGVL